MLQEEDAEKKLILEGSGVSFTEEQAATKIQATYRGYKVRKDTKCSKEEIQEGDEADKADEASKADEAKKPDEKEASEPDKKEKE